MHNVVFTIFVSYLAWVLGFKLVCHTKPTLHNKKLKVEEGVYIPSCFRENLSGWAIFM